MNKIEDTLDQRGKRYGDFLGHAIITQELKAVMQRSVNWNILDVDIKEPLR